ncbi:16859_t:CDS:1, partial [Funneliformis mosseae]
HLATVLLNLIENKLAIPKRDIHNPALVDASLIKTGVDNYLISPYSFSHNQRWGFRSVDDKTKLE